MARKIQVTTYSGTQTGAAPNAYFEVPQRSFPPSANVDARVKVNMTAHHWPLETDADADVPEIVVALMDAADPADWNLIVRSLGNG